MAERFRFRLPWITSRPTAVPQRPPPPVETTRAPAQPSAPVPVQQPSFQTPGTAPVQPSPPESQEPEQTESLPPSPPQPQEPEQTESQPPSPPQSQEPEQTESQPPSPPQPQEPEQTESQPPSPPQPQEPEQTESQPPSPPQSQEPEQTESQPPSPSQSQEPQQTEPQPPSLSPATYEAPSIAQPASPSQAPSQPLAAAPQSPSRAVTESRVTSQPASPARMPPQSKATSVPPSPSPTTWQPQSPSLFAAQRARQTNSLPPSPSRTAKETLKLPPISGQPPSSAPEQELKPEAVSDVLSESLKQEGAMQASDNEITAPPAPAAPASSQRSDSEAVGVDLPAYVSEPVKEVEETKEDKEGEEQLIREGKTSNSSIENEQRESGMASTLFTAAPESSTQLQQPNNLTSHSEPRLQEKEDAYERKKGPATKQNGERLRTVSLTRSKANHVSSGSHQKPMMLTGEEAPLHKEIKDDISKFVHELGTGLPIKPGETPVSVVTLAGENSGAVMHLGSEPLNKNGSIPIHRSYKINPDDSTGGTTTDAEESCKDGSSKDPSVKEDSPIRAYINSNAQSINNSMLFGSSVKERNPGVRMAFSCNPAELASSSTKPGPPSTLKAQFNVTPAKKLTYEPTVRRRCLRGLFLEPSDSEPDNPEKPRRHGCRFTCGEESKDRDTGVL